MGQNLHNDLHFLSDRFVRNENVTSNNLSTDQPPVALDPIHRTFREARIRGNKGYYHDLNKATRTTHHTEHSASNDPAHGGNGKGSGNGPPSWFKQWHQKHSPRPGQGGGGSGGPKVGRGSGGFQGANAIPNLTLPNTTTTGTPSSGGISPIFLILGLAAIGGIAWYLYHKAHLTKEQDKAATRANESE